MSNFIIENHMQEQHEALKPYFEIPDIQVKKTLLFILTHRYTVFNSTKSSVAYKPSGSEEFFSIMQERDVRKKVPTPEYWHEIIEGLYLGKIPEMNSNYNQADDIIKLVNGNNYKRPLKLVLTLLEDFELAGIGMPTSSPVSPLDWSSRGIEHHHIIMSDFSGNAPLELIIYALLKLKKTLDSHYSVLVHCKAGKGRSALSVLSFLTLFGDGKNLFPGKDVTSAFKFLKEKRLISINDQQLKTVVDLVDYYHNNEFKLEDLELTPTIGTSVSDIDILLTKKAALNTISNLTSFKELRRYANRHLKIVGTCQRSEHIRELCTSIFKAQDSKWFIDMMKGDGPLSKFINARPFPASELDNNYRLAIANMFKDEMTELVANALSWSKSELIEIINLDSNLGLSLAKG